MPFIEKTLKALKNQQEEPLFTKVTNLTRIIENEKDEQVQDETRAMFRGGKGITYNMSAESKKIFESTLASDDYFLKINILVVNELIEYQFTLYRIMKSGVEQNINEYIFRITNDFEEPEKTVNIFINPKERDYLTTLENALKQLFPPSNTLPTPKIYINGALVDKATYCTIKDTLFFDASYSFDKQTSRENLKYTWTQLPATDEKTIPDKRVISLNQNQANQILAFPETGNYRIGVSVSDGIGNSQVLYVDVFVIESSIVFLPVRKVELIEFKPKRSSSKPLGFQLDLRVMQYLKKDLYYVNNYKDMQVVIQRLSKTALNKSYAQISKIVKNEKGVVLDKMLHPEVLTCDTVITKSGFTLKMHLDPFDTWNDKKYTFSVQVIDHGVKSNIEVFKVKYTPLTWGIQVKKLNFGQNNEPDAEYLPYENIHILSTDVTFSPVQNPLSPGKKITSQSYSSLYLVGVSRFITNRADIAIGFLPKRFWIKERISLPELKSANLRDSTIFIQYEQAWTTIIPSISIGINIIGHISEKSFEIYDSKLGLLENSFLRYSFTVLFMKPLSINLHSQKNDNFLSPAALKIYEPLVKQKVDSFNQVNFRPMIMMGGGWWFRVLRKPMVHFSIGVEFTYFHKIFGVGMNLGLQYDLI